MFIARPPGVLRWLLPLAVWRIKTNEKKVYLTFDDGPVPEVTPWVLDLLKSQNIKATFFCVGENVGKYPRVYQRVLEEGHRVGNHTFNHRKGFKNKVNTYVGNVMKAETLIHSNLFRPPHGQLWPSLLRKLNLRYKVIMWDVLSGDYDKGRSGEKCFSDVVRNVRCGSIIVFHDSIKARQNLQVALPLTIKALKEMGYEFEVIPFNEGI